MPRKSTAVATPPDDARVVDIDVSEEMRTSFLEYAYSVIYSRALPDARDGLKPVQRRILFQMAQMGLRPDRGHVKCARVVGDVMGRLHPHGDSAIYDALVRMAQPFALRLPFVDGHGNFGSLDDGPAAMRYTECRLAASAATMTDSLDEDVVDFVANYDGREREPSVLPAAIPALLINGASGIAVGMATNMAPHNVAEVCSAAALMLARKKVTLADVMDLVPGPDFPTGGQLLGLDGVRDAYTTGRGSLRVRATTRIESVSPRRQGIVVTELPFNVGPERVTERIKDLVNAGKIDGIANLVDLTDGDQGLKLVIEVKNGFSADAVRDALFRLTPLEETFNINNVALVDGQPRTLGLLELLRVFVDHRLEVVRRRCEFRRSKAQQRLHLVEGLLIAVLEIDEVVALIRSSNNAADARQRLVAVFDLSELQATHILDMPLRRLTKYSQLELRSEQDKLTADIAALSQILADDSLLRSTARKELLAIAAQHDTPRRTVLVDGTLPQPPSPKEAADLKVADAECLAVLTCAGSLLRVDTDQAPPHDAGTPAIPASPALSVLLTHTHGEIGLVTSAGAVHRLSVVDIPSAPVDRKARPSGERTLGAPASEYATLAAGEVPIALIDITDSAVPVALGTEAGIVKRVLPGSPKGKPRWDVIGLKAGDRVVGAGAARDDAELVFVTSDAQLLRFKASSVRPQGRSGGGVAGINLRPGARVACFAAAEPSAAHSVVTVAGRLDQLAGIASSSIKSSLLSDFPIKGRATAGVRCHRLSKGEDAVLLAQVAPQVVAEAASGRDVPLPASPMKRDASGERLATPVAVLGLA